MGFAVLLKSKLSVASPFLHDKNHIVDSRSAKIIAAAIFGINY